MRWWQLFRQAIAGAIPGPAITSEAVLKAWLFKLVAAPISESCLSQRRKAHSCTVDCRVC